MFISEKECPVCKQKFKYSDDIVVCPECGARYHRECYNKVGECLFKDKHYTSECPKVKKEKKDPEVKTKICPNCSQENPESAIFCNRCGFSFGDEVNDNEFSNKNEVDISSIPGIEVLLDPMGGVNPNEKFDSISASDIAKYVNVNSAYYLNVFKRIKDFKRSRFNFCAFLFSGGWLLYRKQYKLGSLITIIMALFSIASTYIMYFFYYPILADVLSAADIGLSDRVLTPEQSNAVMQQLLSLPYSKILILLAPSVMFFIGLLIMFIIGFKGNKIYMKHVIAKVSKLKEESKNNLANYNERLETEGGVNVPLGICLACCYVIINWLPQFFI